MSMNITNTGALPTAAATATSGSGASGASSPNSQFGPDSFIQLLTAQLQNQTPSSTLDPNQMMTEMVQFNSLEQLMSINQVLTQQFASAAGGGTAPSTTGSAPSASSTVQS